MARASDARKASHCAAVGHFSSSTTTCCSTTSPGCTSRASDQPRVTENEPVIRVYMDDRRKAIDSPTNTVWNSHSSVANSTSSSPFRAPRLGLRADRPHRGPSGRDFRAFGAFEFWQPACYWSNFQDMAVGEEAAMNKLDREAAARRRYVSDADVHASRRHTPPPISRKNQPCEG
jgi:hypothetical protein